MQSAQLSVISLDVFLVFLFASALPALFLCIVRKWLRAEPTGEVTRDEKKRLEEPVARTSHRGEERPVEGPMTGASHGHAH